MLERFLKNKNIGQKLKTIFLLCIVLQLMLLMLFLTIFYQIYLKPNYITEQKSILNEICNSLSQEMQYIDNTSLAILNNEKARNYLSSKDGYKETDTINSLYQYIYMDQFIESIYLIRPDGEYVFINYTGSDGSREFKPDGDWFTSLDKLKGKGKISVNANGAIKNNKDDVLSFMRTIYDINSQKKIGYLIINISMNLFSQHFSAVNNTPVYIGALDDSTNRFIAQYSSNIDSKLISEILDKNHSYHKVFHHYNKIQIPLYDWGISLIYISEIKIWNALSKSIGIFTLLFVGITIFSISLFSAFISGTITKPVEALAKSMNRIKEGKLYRVSMNTANDEIGSLKDTYNEMLIETDRLINKLVSEEKEKNHLELRILQEQINPHFLYNTLSNIEYTAVKNQDMETYHYLEILSRFYHNCLSGGDQVIAIKREVQITKDYLELQKMRFGDLFSSEFHIDDAVNACLIPRLTLQPLVENSLVHGIIPSGEKGTIEIMICSKENKISILISDTGIGIEKNALDQIVKGNSSENFGLAGTLKRLHYYYDIDNFYSIDSKEGEYTKIELLLPMVTGDKNEND